MTNTIPMFCQTCGQRYQAGTVWGVLERICLCGGELRAELATLTVLSKAVSADDAANRAEDREGGFS